MAIEAKPLFHPEVLRGHINSFEMPRRVDEYRDRLTHWSDLISSGRIDQFKETDLLPDFINDFFCGLLGYTRPAGAEQEFTLSRETYVESDGKYADAVIGRFSDERNKYVVALEGKGPRDPIDRPFAGRKVSAVDQGYRYAINLPCDWIIVTTMRETRLYHKGSDQYTFERFETVRLANEEYRLSRFMFLLGAERVVPENGQTHFYELLEATEAIGRQITNDFYSLYSNIRLDALEKLKAANPTLEPIEILRCTQKLLDRILFCAFCEDRGLLPSDTLMKAYSHSDPYNPKPIWENFLGLFRAIDEGSGELNIPAYNGGLFAVDPVLDQLNTPDDVCAHFESLGKYEFRQPSEVDGDPRDDDSAKRLIDVEILGHIFEQSITDLERIRSDIDATAQSETNVYSRRKKEGAFYTPDFVTRYIVDQALGTVLDNRFEELRIRQRGSATGTSRTVLNDPKAYDLAALNSPQRNALIAFWTKWQEELKTIKVVDPACGSGAFLIQAFDYLYQVLETSNLRLEELRGQRTFFDLDRQILQNNLYGVDLNSEAIQICQLGLWIKTATRGKELTSLDATIVPGNSIVSDPVVHPAALDWKASFPEVFSQGGFDVVIGNPPYVRQELLGDIKPWLQEHYASYHGMADLYVYFYELAIRLLKPGGTMSYIVTNKWMKANYGESLRRYFTEAAWVRSVVDFGHAKQFFPDADVFPSILVAQKPTDGPKPETAQLCSIPRDQVRIDDLSVQIEVEGLEMDLDQLAVEGWQLEPRIVQQLLRGIREDTVPLKEYLGHGSRRGVLTGCNEAFVVDKATKDRLLAEDPSNESVLKPFLRGQDIKRWHSAFSDQWVIFTRRGIDIDAYPSIKSYLSQFREKLEPKPKGWKSESGEKWPGRKSGPYKWYEIQDSIAFYEEFSQPKIYYQEIQYHPAYAFDAEGLFGNNKTFFVQTDDFYLLGVLNSPLMWWHNWRYLPHMKDEALTPVGYMMEELPIAIPSERVRLSIEESVSELISLTNDLQERQSAFLDWLKVEHQIDKPSRLLTVSTLVSSDQLVEEVRRLRGKKNPLSSMALKSLRDEYNQSVDPAIRLTERAKLVEANISDKVIEAYGLSSGEVELMWKSAPPRTPLLQ